MTDRLVQVRFEQSPREDVAHIRSEAYVGGWPGRFADTTLAALTPRRESFGPLSDIPFGGAHLAVISPEGHVLSDGCREEGQVVENTDRPS